MIVVIDCGIGNLQSVVRALERVGADAVASSNPADVAAAERLVLPGVGSFASGMDNLRRHSLIPLLRQRVLIDEIPVLGICLGMQMLAQRSEEGDAEGLGWIPGEVQRLTAATPALKIPHLGWNDLDRQVDSPLFSGVPEDACFYFAHSYALATDAVDCIAATAEYGARFVAAVHRGNLFGTQFHPEKSHAHGLRVLRNFVEYR